jgi:16S rRNA C1402 N4-methylase RsmH
MTIDSRLTTAGADFGVDAVSWDDSERGFDYDNDND